jgi:hypothetical protein
MLWDRRAVRKAKRACRRHRKFEKFGPKVNAARESRAPARAALNRVAKFPYFGPIIALVRGYNGQASGRREEMLMRSFA